METSLVTGNSQSALDTGGNPEAIRERATRVANILQEIIKKQKLYVSIQGNEYVKVDGWIGLGNLMGYFPREVYVKELEDGSYESCVEIVNAQTGMTLSKASALCGVDEKRWANADKYARRSMSCTRATGKAFRLGFSWVMCMAGFSPTPAEEMPEESKEEQKQYWNVSTHEDRTKAKEEKEADRKQNPQNYSKGGASVKSIKKLYFDAKNNNLTKDDLKLFAKQRYGKDYIEELTQKQVSDMIKEVNTLTPTHEPDQAEGPLTEEQLPF